MAKLFLMLSTGRGSVVAYQGLRSLKKQGQAADSVLMGQPQRLHTYDDELHERRRQLAIVRPPIDFEAARLKRLVEKARDTRDP
ncbi:MAG TPA: hypothetical protein PJ994_09285 [Tepidiformaceae bacterium]|nr:hypothetical protein [Tepidiformaceae bacterium]